jgi:hypothetical protein
LDVQNRFDDEVKNDSHGAFTPEMLKLPQTTWITTFLEGVTDKITQIRNRLDQMLVEKLVHTHTNLVLRESLDDTIRDLLRWDIELVIDEPIDEKEEEPEVPVWIVVTYLIC